MSGYQDTIDQLEVDFKANDIKSFTITSEDQFTAELHDGRVIILFEILESLFRHEFLAICDAIVRHIRDVNP